MVTDDVSLEDLATLAKVKESPKGVTLFFKNGAGPEITVSSLEDLREYWVCGQNPAKLEVHLKINSGQSIALPMNHYDALKAKYTGKDPEILNLIEVIELTAYDKTIDATPMQPLHKVPKIPKIKNI